MANHAPIPALSARQQARFWANVEVGPAGVCWLWRGPTNRGYGKLDPPGAYAHRVMWLLEHGSLPIDKDVLHTCDSPACVNPSHLYLGDPLANAGDRVTRGRGQRGRKLTDEQVAELRRRANEDPRHLAHEFGLSPGYTYDLLAGRKRSAKPSQRRTRKLTPDQVAEIRRRPDPIRALAREFGVSHTTIRNILSHKIHRR